MGREVGYGFLGYYKKGTKYVSFKKAEGAKKRVTVGILASGKN